MTVQRLHVEVGQEAHGPCPCGCGALTRLAPVTKRDRGWVKGQPRHHNRNRKDPSRRFEVDERTGCWLWTGSLSHGYGSLRFRGQYLRAHRWMYEQVKGPIPSGMELDHLCRVTQCVNPDHLEPVTRAENARRSPNTTRLNVAQVREIRRSGESNRALAGRLGVSEQHVSQIRSGKKWRGVDV